MISNVVRAVDERQPLLVNPQRQFDRQRHDKNGERIQNAAHQHVS